MINKLLISSLLSASVLLSCTIPNQKNTVRQNIADLQNGSSKKGASVTLAIREAFQTKASVDGQLPKTVADIMSYSAFLTTDPANPFTSGNNPAGDGVIFSIDRDTSSTGLTTITFTNLPAGGPYYAVVAAFDGLADNSGKVNITASNPDLGVNNNQWAISSNSVTVNANLSLSFSDIELNHLSIVLPLQDGIAPFIETEIAPVDGQVNSSSYNAF